MNPKEADALDEMDMLRYQNWQLRGQLVRNEGEALLKGFGAKYGEEGAQINLSADGKIARVPV